MKSILVTLIILFLFKGSLSGQTKDYLYCGVDFGNAKFFGVFHDKNAIKDKFLNAWNDEMLTYEYEIRHCLNTKEFKYDLSAVYKRNSQVPFDSLFNYSRTKLSEDLIGKILKTYSLQEKNGTGVVIIIEAFDKNNEEAVGWVTLFDLKTLLVIKSNCFIGRASNKGMTKHWTNGIMRIIKKAKSNDFFGTKY